jgi:hypothetical protein
VLQWAWGGLHEYIQAGDNVTDDGLASTIFVWTAEQYAKDQSSDCEIGSEGMVLPLSGRKINKHSASRHENDEVGEHDCGMGFTDMELGGGSLHLLGHDKRWEDSRCESY